MTTIAAGQLFWLTGLAGAGKTTIGRELFALVRAMKPNAVFLDGDGLREVFGSLTNYAPDERRRLAFQYARLCKVLTDQGIDVVCATISMFADCRAWNRAHVPGYREIYVRVPMPVLIARDQKQLYSRALSGEISHVMGIDVPIEAPEQPDVIVDNDGTRAPGDLARELFARYYPSQALGD